MCNNEVMQLNEAYMRANEHDAMLGADLATAAVVFLLVAMVCFAIGRWRNRK